MKGKPKGSIVPMRSEQQAVLLSVIVPVYNEANGILIFHKRLEAALKKTMVRDTEIIYINDGSNDNSLHLLKTIVDTTQNSQLIEFTRNFGKEAALTAGIDHSCGDGVIIIDADLQDPPELIPDMVKQWLDGYDIVNMCRYSRAGETYIKKKTADMFYLFMEFLGPVKMPKNVGDFRLMSRRAIDALKQMPERNRFMKGMFAWIGFPIKQIHYRRDPRYADSTKWGYWGLINLAVEGITSYSTAPLRFSTYIGMSVSLSSFCYGAYILLNTLLYGDPVQGFPTLIIVILLLGGLQLMAIGIAGEYLGRIFMETKKRPIYLVKDHYKRIPTPIAAPREIPKRKLV